uniref:Uncharacterized protein n=1 Tax=Nelumbo nucifera TaxID=4432 RepID=A0A822Y3L8_NELNU|nr:TPA_asm: hypothetical protein HUJ06_028330 [Nelumbo nucifera]
MDRQTFLRQIYRVCPFSWSTRKELRMWAPPKLPPWSGSSFPTPGGGGSVFSKLLDAHSCVPELGLTRLIGYNDVRLGIVARGVATM